MILFILRVELDKSENFTIEKPYCTFIGYPNTFYLKKIIKKSRLGIYHIVSPQRNITFSVMDYATVYGLPASESQTKWRTAYLDVSLFKKNMYWL